MDAASGGDATRPGGDARPAARRARRLARRHAPTSTVHGDLDRRRHRHLAEHRAHPARRPVRRPAGRPRPRCRLRRSRRSRPARSAVLTDPAGLDLLPPGTPAIVVRRAAARARARWPRGSTATPPPRCAMIGVTGTQGKTTTTRLLEQGLAASGVTGGRDRHRRHPDRRRGHEDRAHHPRGARPARPLRADARARRGHLRDGGLQPRAGDGPRRRRRLRRRDLPQPRSRPPRLPRRRRGLLRRQGAPLHPRARPAGPDQRRRRVRPAAARRGDDPDVDVLRRGAGRRLAGRRRRADAGAASTFTVLGPDGRACRTGVHLPGEFNVSNALAAIASAALAGLDPQRGRRRASPRSVACPAGWSRSTPARTSPSSSTTPTSPTPSRPCSPRCARSPTAR